MLTSSAQIRDRQLVRPFLPAIRVIFSPKYEFILQVKARTQELSLSLFLWGSQGALKRIDNPEGREVILLLLVVWREEGGKFLLSY